MADYTTPSDFYFAGLITPSRICRLAGPALRSYLAEARRGQWNLDPELVLWMRAVDLEGQRWATYGGVSQNDDLQPESAELTHEPLSVAEVAELLGCKSPGVRYHVREGHLAPCRRDPYLFDPSEVDRFLAARVA